MIQSSDISASQADKHLVRTGRNSDSLLTTVGYEKTHFFFFLLRLSFFSSLRHTPRVWTFILNTGKLSIITLAYFTGFALRVE